MADDVNQRIAARVRDLRAGRGLSLEALAARSGVSRSMISLIERSEASPTAVVLEKLAAGLETTLPALFDTPGESESLVDARLSRRSSQPQWQDPASGYARRNVSPPAAAHPFQIVEVEFPPGGRVAFENGGGVRVHQQVWILEGTMDITLGTESYQLHQGDCLAMDLDQPTTFHNSTRKPARYAVVIASDNGSKP